MDAYKDGVFDADLLDLQLISVNVSLHRPDGDTAAAAQSAGITVESDADKADTA